MDIAKYLKHLIYRKERQGTAAPPQYQIAQYKQLLDGEIEQNQSLPEAVFVWLVNKQNTQVNVVKFRYTAASPYYLLKSF